MNSLTIDKRLVGPGSDTLIIVEVGQAHDGSLGTAHAFIDAIADVGADAVKFQTHIASGESTPVEPWRVKFSKQDETRYDYWRRMEFSEEQWRGLKEHADERGLLFISSPFCIQAVELLTRIGVPAWKIASGETGNQAMLEKMVATGLPILLSTGMSPLTELDEAVSICKQGGVAHGVFQCSSFYPCPPEKVGLNMLSVFQKRYGCPVGLSDHSGTIFPSLAAVSLGAKLVEVHVTMSRQMFGPDVVASVTIEELADLVKGIRFIDASLAHPVDKDSMAGELEPMRALFTKSVVAVQDLPAGTIIEDCHLVCKKPGSGISPERLSEIIGCRLKKEIHRDELLTNDHIEWK
ncbi:MAG: N-acetylneuraminate synthase family protein [Desulfobulbaceae bacterium]|nr:N-acetylneuraminate synthase family protein [Desulfobulbaceae bacterium]